MSEAHSGRRHVRRAAQPSQNGLILSFAPARLAIALTVARPPVCTSLGHVPNGAEKHVVVNDR
jgi:hypothetical protein